MTGDLLLKIYEQPDDRCIWAAVWPVDQRMDIGTLILNGQYKITIEPEARHD